MPKNFLKWSALACYIYFALKTWSAAKRQDTANAVYYSTFAICSLITAFVD